VHGLAQVGSRGVRSELRPQGIHHLLAVKPMSRGKRKQLDETGRLAAPPRRGGKLLRPYGNAKAAE
jgi:hypothetical protein